MAMSPQNSELLDKNVGWRVESPAGTSRGRLNLRLARVPNPEGFGNPAR